MYCYFMLLLCFLISKCSFLVSVQSPYCVEKYYLFIIILVVVYTPKQFCHIQFKSSLKLHEVKLGPFVDILISV